MFVLTAKVNKKRLAAILLAVLLLAVFLAVIICAAGREKQGAGEIRSAEDAAQYLASLGWQVSPEPLEVQKIVIPREFTGVYEDYLRLQKQQGFRLEKYAGLSAVRYTFAVLNYPSGEDGIVADLVIYGSSVIGGDIQSTALNGFMEGLRDSAPTPVPSATPSTGIKQTVSA